MPFPLGVARRRALEPVGGEIVQHTRLPRQDVLGAEEFGDVRGGRSAKDFLGWTGLQHTPAVEQDRHVAQQPRFGEVVRDLEHRQLPLAMDRAHLAARAGAARGIEGTERFIEQEYARAHRQRTGDRHELALPSTQAHHVAREERGNAQSAPRPRRPWRHRQLHTRCCPRPRGAERGSRAGTRGRCAAPRRGASSASRPSSCNVPPAGGMIPATVSSNVVLPEPAGPITTPYCPAGMAKLTRVEAEGAESRRQVARDDHSIPPACTAWSPRRARSAASGMSAMRTRTAATGIASPRP